MSQFGYCHLVWINHCRTLNNRINGLHKRAPNLVDNDFSSIFFRTLRNRKIYYRNLQTLAYKIFKIKNNVPPEILREFFSQRNQLNTLRNSTTLQGRSMKTVMYGLEIISSLGPKLWDILLTKLKNILSPTLFKNEIHEWSPKNCPYCLC